MSEIKAGDLVQIIRPSRCGCSVTLGTIFVVDHVRLSNPAGLYCVKCGDTLTQRMCAIDKADGLLCELARLKKIPPLDELENCNEEHKLDVRA